MHGHRPWPKIANIIICCTSIVVLFKKNFPLHTKMYLRSTIGEYRLRSLMFIWIKITPEGVIEEFSKKTL